MKKDFLRPLCLLFLLAACLTGTGCQMPLPGSAERNAPTEPERLKAVVFCSEETGISSTISYVAESMADALAQEENITLRRYDLSQGSYSDTGFKVNTAIDLEADVLFLSGASSSSGDLPWFQKLQEEGVRLVLIDGDLPESGRFAYVGTDNLGAGETAANIIREEVSAPSTAILAAPLAGREISPTSSRGLRIRGFREAAQSLGSFSILTERTCSTDIQQAREDIRALLEEYPAVNTLYCVDSAAGAAAASVLKDLGRRDIFLLCHDLPQEVAKGLESGEISASILQDYEGCGRECAQLLRELLSQPDTPPAGIRFVPCRAVYGAAYGNREVQAP